RVDGIACLVAQDFLAVDADRHLACGKGAFDHGDAIIGRSLQAVLLPWIAGGNDAQAIRANQFDEMIGQRDMGAVDGIEAAAEQQDALTGFYCHIRSSLDGSGNRNTGALLRYPLPAASCSARS